MISDTYEVSESIKEVLFLNGFYQKAYRLMD